MDNICENAIFILAGNLNSGGSYLTTTVQKLGTSSLTEVYVIKDD